MIDTSFIEILLILMGSQWHKCRQERLPTPSSKLKPEPPRKGATRCASRLYRLERIFFEKCSDPVFSPDAENTTF
jgi:hypothetical protein